MFITICFGKDNIHTRVRKTILRCGCKYIEQYKVTGDGLEGDDLLGRTHTHTLGHRINYIQLYCHTCRSQPARTTAHSVAATTTFSPRFTAPFGLGFISVMLLHFEFIVYACPHSRRAKHWLNSRYAADHDDDDDDDESPAATATDLSIVYFRQTRSRSRNPSTWRDALYSNLTTYTIYTL